MTRATNTPATHQRRNKIRKQSKGSFGSNNFKMAKERRMKALKNAYIGRKQRKRFFRQDVWISRLNIALRNQWKDQGLNYSRFIHLKNLSHNKLSRKRMSEMAINEPQNFTALIEKVKNPW